MIKKLVLALVAGALSLFANMFYYRFKLTLRNLTRNRLYTAINLSGLTVGIAAAMLVALWVQNELRYDRYHRGAHHLWRIKTDLKINADETWHWGNTPLRITQLCDKIPGITGTAQAMYTTGMPLVVQRGVEFFSESKCAYVGPGWFETFDYRFKEGSAAGFGERPNDLILTESAARRIFGHRSAMDQVLRIDSVDFTVRAILQDPLPHSSFKENVIIPIEAHLQRGTNRKNDESWNNFNYTTFVELRPEADPKAIGKQLTEALAVAKEDSNIVLHLGPLTELHYDQSIKGDHYEKGSLRSVWIFGLVGILILFMAAVNYVGLTTARAHTRAHEVGIQKIIGAGKGQLFGQFIYESALLSCAAGVLAAGLARLALPWFNDISGNQFTLAWNNPMLWLLLGGAIALTIALAGVYPAMMLAGFQPIQALRNKGGAAPRSFFRQGLVVAQFSIAVCLLISTIVISRQRAYIQQKDIGYDRSQVLTFSIGWRQMRSLGPERAAQMQASVADALRQSSAVAQVSRANSSPVHIKNTHSGSVKFDGLPEDAQPTVSQLSADAHFAELFDIRLLEGRWFEANNVADENNVLLNETAARQLGLPKPWVGQRFGFHDREGQVIGIVRDFHFLPLQERITPLVVFNSSNWQGNYFIKTRPGQNAEAIAAAEKVWKQWFPDRPFEYTFLDDDFDKMYRSEARAGQLFNLFSGIAILISCLGLFGLAAFVAVQRTKEIGVRKVLGATVISISGLLTKDFLRLVLLSILIASPLAWYVMQAWLSDFAYRIEMGWPLFAAAALIAMAVACLTVGFQSVKAALANPMESLRSE